MLLTAATMLVLPLDCWILREVGAIPSKSVQTLE
jgi:hypothetical protein